MSRNFFNYWKLLSMFKTVSKNYKKNQFQRKKLAITMINISQILAVSTHLLTVIDRWPAVICSSGFRYIDDIFFIWTHGKDKLEKFLDDLNSFDNNIKFTHESSKENVTFLDLIVKLSKGRLTTDLHIKDTDRHQYLHFNSSNPGHTKRSIIYSQALRLTKIYTFENDFLRHRDEMKSRFQRRAIWKILLTLKWKK